MNLTVYQLLVLQILFNRSVDETKLFGRDLNFRFGRADSQKFRSILAPAVTSGGSYFEFCQQLLENRRELLTTWVVIRAQSDSNRPKEELQMILEMVQTFINEQACFTRIAEIKRYINEMLLSH